MGDALRKRKLVAAEAWKTYRLGRGPNFALERRRAAADLTTDMLARRAPTRTWNPALIVSPQSHCAWSYEDVS